MNYFHPNGFEWPVISTSAVLTALFLFSRALAWHRHRRRREAKRRPGRGLHASAIHLRALTKYHAKMHESDNRNY